MRLVETRKIDRDTWERVYINDNGDVVVARARNFDKLLETIAVDREHAKGKDMLHVASLPIELIEKWKNETGFDWYTATEKERKAKLNDSDNKAFRVYEGKI